MIKRIEKFKSKNGEFICGLCGETFPKKNKTQRDFLRPSRQVKVGNEPILILPRICFKCDADIIKAIQRTFV